MFIPVSILTSTPRNAVAVDTSIGACQGRGLGTTRDLCLVRGVEGVQFKILINEL